MTKSKWYLTVILLFALSYHITAQTVYITETGQKYHAKNCSIVKTGKKGILLTDAKAKGYKPCKICKIEEMIAEEEKKKKEKAAKK
jgi:methylphosphotriester-DNA--protein-cysteine methyltransferase